MYNQNQHLMRWSLIVQGYNLVIKHKKGVENVIADALSRAGLSKLGPGGPVSCRVLLQP